MDRTELHDQYPKPIFVLCADPQPKQSIITEEKELLFAPNIEINSPT